jgi:hypothetical protein
VCATFTLVDGAVLARAAFSHSMNYRSAVVYGPARRVEDPEERSHALGLMVDHVVPGRSATLRPHSRKELAATTVIAITHQYVLPNAPATPSGVGAPSAPIPLESETARIAVPIEPPTRCSTFNCGVAVLIWSGRSTA